MTLRHVDLFGIWLTIFGLSLLAVRALFGDVNDIAWLPAGVTGVLTSIVGTFVRAFVAQRVWKSAPFVGKSPPEGWDVWIEGPYGAGPHRNRWEAWVQSPAGETWRAVSSPLVARVFIKKEPTLWDSKDEALSAAYRELAKVVPLRPEKDDVSCRSSARTSHLRGTSREQGKTI